MKCERITPIEFTRDPGPFALLGVRAHTHEILQREIDSAGLEGVWTVSDLSLGAWKGHQVARDFCEQLAIDLSCCEHPAPVETSEDRSIAISYADIVGEFIDAEARGDRSTIESLNFAKWIIRKVEADAPRLFMVVAPRYAIPWESENILFIRLFAQALKGTRCGLVLIAADESDPDVPVDWNVNWSGGAQAPPAITGEDIVGLVPGVIAPELADTLRRAELPLRENLIPLANGYLLVPPERRRDPKNVPRLEFDRLGMAARPYGWLDAYAQFHGNNMYVEPWFLFAEARRRFAEGGTEITLRLLERAIAHIRMGLDWGVLQSYAQGLRVASRRFTDAGRIPDPPTTFPNDMRSFLLQSKGWGLVMTGDLPLAGHCFRQARALTDRTGGDRREYLYLLNIFALYQLKIGEIEDALATEREIEERRQRLSRPDRRLQYVNSINIARLYRRLGDLQKAEEYFGDAFSTALGARSESDAIYANVVLAKLYEKYGKHRHAFTYWMRAGLHWAASDTPEAVGGRTIGYILGEKLRPGANMPEAIAASLSASILSAMANSGAIESTHGLRWLDLNGRSAPVFARTERIRRILPHAVIPRALLTSGFSILATQDVVMPQILGENSTRLRVLLYTLLEALAPPGFLAEIETLVVDDAFGREIPSTLEELLPVCVRLGVQDVAIMGKVITLNPNIRARIERSLQARIGCAVESLAFHDEHAIVFFKRYLPPTILTLEGSRLLALIENNTTVDEILRRCGESDSTEDVLRLLRELEEKRVLNIDFPAALWREIEQNQLIPRVG